MYLRKQAHYKVRGGEWTPLLTQNVATLLSPFILEYNFFFRSICIFTIIIAEIYDEVKNYNK